MFYVDLYSICKYWDLFEMPIPLQNCICCWKLSTSLQSSNFVVGKCRLHSQIEVGVGNSLLYFQTNCYWKLHTSFPTCKCCWKLHTSLQNSRCCWKLPTSQLWNLPSLLLCLLRFDTVFPQFWHCVTSDYFYVYSFFDTQFLQFFYCVHLV